MAWFWYHLSHNTEEAYRELLAIPGVGYRDRNLVVPDNAAWLVEQILAKHDIRWKNNISRADGPPLGDLSPLTKHGLRDWVPAFMTGYQQDAVMSLGHRSGHLWHAAGCLDGDTEIVVNRNGGARRMTIRELVYRFNGGISRHPRNGRMTVWDQSMPVYAQSIDEADGFIKKNRIMAAVASGRKVVYRLITDTGASIKATADHRFLTPNGWKKLGELSVGESVLVEVWPTRGDQEAKKKNYYRQVENLWQHPNVTITMPGPSRGSKRQARVPYHRLVMEASINGVSTHEFIGRVALGEIEGLKFLPADQHVHHIDEDTGNNDLSNLELLSAEEHHRRHGKEDGWKHVSAKGVPSRILSIDRIGERETFDLSMANPHNNFVANGIVVHNSGKTLTSIAWSLCHPGNTLVVTRASVRRSYGREIERFTHHRAFVIETQTDCMQLDDLEAMYVVIGWEMLPDCIESILKWKPVNVIYDELHKCKSWKRWGATPRPDGTVKFDPLGNMAAAAYRVSRAAKYRLGATATPIKDRVRDLWAQMDLVHPDAWGPFYKPDKASFAGRYCAARGGAFGGIETTGSSNLDELWDRASIVAHSVPHSVTHRHLPPRRRLVTYIQTKDQNAAAGFAAVMKKAAKGGRGMLLEAKLMEAAAKKRKYLLELVSEAVENAQKVIIFTGRREDCDKLAEEVRKEFAHEAKVFSGHGGTPAGDRDTIQQEYMAAAGPAILVGTGDAWGEGVNLQDTDLMLIAMLPWTPGQIVQWEGRVARHGQKRPVLIQYLVAENSVDEHVADVILSKLPAVETVAKDDSVAGLADQLRGSDDEEAIIDSILSKLGVA